MNFRPIQALRLAARGLRLAPGTAATAALTLGVALSAIVVLLGVLDSALRDLPVPDGHEIVQVQLRDARARPVSLPLLSPSDWAGSDLVEAAGLIQPLEGTLVHADATTVRTYGAAMSISVLPLLQVEPALGRLPGPDPQDLQSLVLGWDAWRAMGGDRALVGTTVELDGRDYTIIGVMPEGFGFPRRQSFWTVLPPGEPGSEVVLRLAEGAREEAAALALERRLAGIPFPSDVTLPVQARVLSWTAERGGGGEAAAFGALSALVGLLLLVCAANVGTLLMVRAVERARLLSVHAALGASRVQVAFQLFSEALLIALGGGVVGLVGGYSLLSWMQAALSSHWGYYWMRMEVRPTVVVATAVFVVMAGTLAGTAPAFRAMRVNLRDVLTGSPGAGGGRRRAVGRWFIGVQAALSTVGLIAATYMGLGLLTSFRTFAGLPLDQVALGTVTIPDGRYPDPQSRADLTDRIRGEALRVEGVRAATVSSAVPGFDFGGGGLRVRLDTPLADTSALPWIAADAHFLETYGVRILAGRGLTPADDASAAPVALVTAEFARQHLEGTGLDSRLRVEVPGGESRSARVVGVVEDWYRDGQTAGPGRVILPLQQVDPRQVYVSVRTDGPAGPALAGIRQALARVDATLPLEQPNTLGGLIGWVIRIPRVIAGFGLLGGLAGVLVAGIGLYGVMAFQVRAGLQEIGVRMALGAANRRILMEVIRESLWRLLPGVALGLVAGGMGLPLARALMAGGGGRAPSSVLIMVGVVAAMAVVGVLATLVPALRASRLQPVEVLRRD